MPSPIASDPPSSIEHRIAAVGGDLGRAVSHVLDALPGTPHRPQQLAKTLGVNTWMASRLLTATQSREPMAVAHLIPGPEPLRRVLRAAARRKVAAELLQEAEASVGRFEELIRTITGDRSGLDAVISAWLPEVRGKYELSSKQAVYRGMSHIVGSASETDLGAFILHPAADGHRLDQVAIFAMYGLRRLRPGAWIGGTFFGRVGGSPLLTLAGDAANDIHSVLLPEFCSDPTPQLEVRREESATHFALAGDEVGHASAVDLVYAHLRRGSRPRYWEPGIKGKAVSYLTVEAPTRLLIFDVLVHKDVYPDQTPALAVYNTAARGIVEYGDPYREKDRFDMLESVDSLGQGVSKLRTSAVPRYVDLVGQICERMSWRSDDFRCYRCQVEYPVFGSQIIQAFDLPKEPSP